MVPLRPRCLRYGPLPRPIYPDRLLQLAVGGYVSSELVGTWFNRKMRDHLKDTGDFKRFESGVRRHILRQGKPAVAELAAAARQKPTALLCYERLHEECHRSTVAEMLADRLDAGIVAL